MTDSNYAFAITESRVCLRLRAAKGEIKKCVLFYGDRYYPKPRIKMTGLDMCLVASDELFDYFEADLETSYTRLSYYFWLTDGIEDYYYLPGKFTHNPQSNRMGCFHFSYIRREDIALVPEWAKNTVLYQIFPDSFASSHRKITGKSDVKYLSGGQKSESMLGGTLKGITENIDYLTDLGVNCIYLNPIFTAESYHKYDTIDYYSVDPCFGTMSDFKAMVKTCHQNGIRVVLDGVFNHCGWKFFAFRDVCEKGETSKYRDWFYKIEFPVNTEKINYAAFAYVHKMPKLNTGNPEVIKYFCDVGRFWIKECDIDGWRLDVANEVDHGFWRSFRKAVKEEKPDVFLIGEIWEDAHEWLMGDQFDSAMNYRFTDICKSFIASNNISVDEFDNSLGYMLMRYKKQIAQAQMNMLDSHDVPRFLYFCGEDIRRLKLGALFLMTYVGVPSIFAGDEKAITGFKDTEYRSGMVWEDTPETLELFNYYKKLISIRKDYIDVFTGGVKTVFKDNTKGIYAFLRFAKRDRILVVLNNSEFMQTVNIPTQTANLSTECFNSDGINLISGEIVNCSSNGLKLTLQPLSGAILKCF
jgi:glycosidase